MICNPGTKATKRRTMRSVVFVWHANVFGVAGPGMAHMR